MTDHERPINLLVPGTEAAFTRHEPIATPIPGGSRVSGRPTPIELPHPWGGHIVHVIAQDESDRYIAVAGHRCEQTDTCRAIAAADDPERAALLLIEAIEPPRDEDS
jgi:hypothetical protein